MNGAWGARGETEPVPEHALDERQQAAVADGGGLRVVLGAAGTGKTTTLVRAVLARLQAGVPAGSIVSVVFGRAAADEVRAALARAVVSGPVPLVTTFHSLALGIVGAVALAEGDEPPRLLSGAEEDVRIRELLLGAVEDGLVDWPDDLRAALPTLGLANDIRALLARVRELGWDATELTRAARVAEQPAWEAIARFAQMDSEVMALENLIDYTGLMALACHLVETSRFTGEWTHILADDVHNADVLQLRLLRLLAPGRGVLAIANPDAAVYRFRGADRGVLADWVSAADDVVVLRTVHRSGRAVTQAVGRVLVLAPLPGLSSSIARELRSPYDAPDSPNLPPDPSRDGDVTAASYDSPGDALAHVAQDLRRRHLEEGVPWASMAVLVRSGAQIADVHRALERAGVPAHVANDDVPLRAEPAVAVLLSALEAAVRPAALTTDAAIELLVGPLGSVDPADLRILGRHLRQARRAQRPAEPLPSSAELLQQLLESAMRGEAMPTLPESSAATRAAERLGALGSLLGRAGALAAEGGLPADVLWAVWNGPHGWPARLRAAALAGHRPSHHDLDAVTALFDAAERISARYAGVVGVPSFLDALAHQRVPAEPVSRRGAAEAVTVLTAHLAHGRQWQHVTIVGAQEGTWPSLRSRTSVLRADDIEGTLATEVVDRHERDRQAWLESLAQERRLFALALARARRSVHLALVSSADDRGDQPSRFVDDLRLDVQHIGGRPPRGLTLEGLLAELRAAAEQTDDAELRAAAIARLALLARAHADGDISLPAADPSRWWGVLDPTPGAGPVRPSDEPIALSASALESIGQCPLRWFLEREISADTSRGHALAFGSIVHALAEGVANGTLPPDADALTEYADLVWSEIGFEAPWQSVAERQALHDALVRLLAYEGLTGRKVAAAEHGFRVTLPLTVDAGPRTTVDDAVIVRGSIDRVEVSLDGRALLVDLKTGGKVPSATDVAEHQQLALYQAAAQAGALEGVAGWEPEAGVSGGALVHVRVDTSRTDGSAKVVEQAALDAPDLVSAWITDRLRAAVEVVRREEFAATPGPHCRSCPYGSACPADGSGKAVLA